MIIEILDWNRFNPRADRANHSWFRFENKFFTKTFSWTPSEQRTFVYLCCVASQECRSKLSIDIELAAALLKMRQQEVRKQIQLLAERGVLVTAESRRDDGNEPALLLTTNERTNETDERTNILADSANLPVRLDFEEIYKKYPRKEGKTRGMKICQTQVKTPEEYDLLSRAIDRYAEHCARNVSEVRFIKHFSSFMAGWREWLDPATGTIAVREKQKPRWQLEAEEKERRLREEKA